MGMKRLGINFHLKGTVRFELGNEGEANFYRGIYFAGSV